MLNVKTFSFFKGDAVEAGAEFTCAEIIWFKDSRGNARTYFYDTADDGRIVVTVPEDAHLETNRQLVLADWLEEHRIDHREY